MTPEVTPNRAINIFRACTDGGGRGAPAPGAGRGPPSIHRAPSCARRNAGPWAKTDPKSVNVYNGSKRVSHISPITGHSAPLT